MYSNAKKSNTISLDSEINTEKWNFQLKYHSLSLIILCTTIVNNFFISSQQKQNEVTL